MIFVSTSQRGYTDTELYGPFPSVEVAKQNITDNLEQGLDGDDTRYTFHKVSESGTTESIGYIYFYEEYDSNNGLETKKEEYFVIGYEV